MEMPEFDEKLHIKEAQQMPSRVNTEFHTQTYNSQMLKVKDKKKIMKAVREN